MTHLIVVVEGQTEAAFVKDVIKPHLDLRGVFASPTIVGKLVAHERGHTQRGGGHFKNWRRDIEHILKRNRNLSLHVTTMFDLYGLPDGFPGLEQHCKQPDTRQRCEALEACLAAEFDNINDGERTAPSKRLTARIPGYSKALHGPGATSTTGLPQLRSTCPRFDAWISKLERLAG